MAGERGEYEDGFCNITELHRLLGKDRKTIRQYIDRHGIQPAGSRKSTPVYRVSDVCQALYGSAGSNAECDLDPNKMEPMDRKAFYESEIKRLAFEKEIRILVSKDDARQDYLHLAKSLAQSVMSYPDRAERDYGASPQEVERLIFLCDELQNTLADVIQDC